MLSTMDSFSVVVKNALSQPIGFDGRITRNIWSCSDVDSSYGGYEWYAHFFDYFCSDGIIKKANETSTNLRISVNTLDAENFLRRQFFFEPYGIVLFSIPPPAGAVHGNPCYQMFSNGEDPKTWTERYAVLLTRNDSVRPFTAVTKGEFYAMVRSCIQKEKEARKQNIITHTKIRPRKELEDALKARMDEIDKSSLGTDARNARKRRLQQDFRTDEEMLQEALDRVDKQYQSYTDKLNEMESRFKNELNTPVYTKDYEFTLDVLNTSYNNQHLFNDSLHGYMIVRANPSYFKATPQKWRPQFLLITWKRQNGFLYSRNLESLWRSKLDMGKLKSFLLK